MRIIVLLFFTLFFSPLYADTDKQIFLTSEEKVWIETHPEITVGGGVEWAPFNFVNDDGEYDGIAHDYLKLISEKTGLDFVIELRPTWQENLTRFKNGQVDMLPSVYYSKERENYGNFSKSYFKMREFIFFLENRKDIHGIDDLKGKTIAIPKGYATIGQLKALDKNITILETSSILEAIKAVMSSKADALIEGQAVIDYTLQQNMISGLTGIPQTAFDPSFIYFLLDKSEPMLLQIIQKALDAISKKEKEAIKKRWLRSALIHKTIQINFNELEHRWIKQHPHINFTGDPNWLPFEAFNKQGEYIGIIADTLKLVEERSGLTFNKIPTESWEESVDLLKSGKVDMLTETTDSLLRSEFLFTQSFLPNPIVVIMQDGSSYVDTLSQLKKKSIILIKGYGYIDKIKEKYPDHTFHEVENIQEGLSAVARGEHDVILTTMALGSYTIKNMQLSTIRIVGKTEFTTQLGFAINRDYAPLVGILNKVFKSIDEQTKQNILSKWVTQEYIEKTDYTLIYQIAGIAFLIIFGTLFWSWRLKKEIIRRSILEKKLEEVNRQITDSIEFAAIIQHIFIPEEEELSDFFEDSFAIWKPRDIVGGDIYFFDILKDKNKAILMVIDCTGHGVPGAFVTMLVKALVRNLIAHINQENEQVSPAKLLAILNRSLRHILKQQDKNSISNAGFDAAIIYIDKESGQLTYAGANIPLFYIQDKEITTIKANRHSIGYKTSNEDYVFIDHHISLRESKYFYLTTDGYLDQNGGDKGFPMGKKRFKSLIETHIDKPMREQKKNFEKALLAYQHKEDRNDDITVVGFSCKGLTDDKQ